MRIEFTLRGTTGEQDVAVTVAGSDPLAAVLPDLAVLAGATVEERPYLAGREVRADDTVGTAGLRDGSVLDFVSHDRRDGAPAEGLWSVHVVAGGSPRQPTPLRRGGVNVGRDAGCDIVLTDDRVSRRHARLEVRPTGVVVHDLGTTNGTSIDGIVVGAGGVTVAAGAVIRVGDSLLAVRSGSSPPGDSGPGPMLIDAAEADAEGAGPGRVPWLAALLPAVVGGVLAWVTASPLFLLFTAISPLVLLVGALGERVQWRRTSRRATSELRARRAAVAGQVTDALHVEAVTCRSTLPDSTTLRDIAQLPGRRRQRSGRLVVRVGSGDLPATTLVRAGTSETPAGTVHDVPIPVDLTDGALGIAGLAADVRGTARWLIAQLAVRHGPADLSVLIVSPGPADEWRWCRWLPHRRTPVVVTPTDAPTAIGSWLAGRRVERRAAAEPWPGPWLVAVVDASATGDDGSALADLLADGAALGVTAVWLATSERDLPAVCRTTIVPDEFAAGRVRVRSAGEARTVLSEHLSVADADDIARALAPHASAHDDHGPPDRCRLGDLLPDTGVRELWSASTGGARTPLGLSAGGAVEIDLARDGPHALVAGTTGSGKSELLRSIVTGLALHQPPDEVRFLLVDYKGGAAFADAVRLPHTDGVVTDLDAAATNRALRSLRAELRRRERLFAETGATDLRTYRADCHGRPQVPRLVVVVDEFAELAADQPEFVSGLVAVARRGRSLGVHLVLATQRPSGAVSAEIRANTTLRIALRVTEPAESIDVVGVPDAAAIAPQLPGRCVVRTGDGVIRVQAAMVAADPDRGRPRIERLGPWRDPTHRVPDAAGDELARIVDRLRDAAVDRTVPPPPWLPPLPASLSLTELATLPDTALAIGRLDLPDDQAQPNLLVSWGDAVLIAGRARSGRTSALVTVALAAALRHSPAELHLYSIDRTGGLAAALEGLPHLGTALSAARAPELVPRLLRRLAEGGPTRTVLLVDDWDAILAGGTDLHAARSGDLLATLVRDRSPHVLVVMTGSRAVLLPRVAGGFGTRLLLPLDDGNDYALAGIAAHAVPTDPSAGSGVRAADGAVFRIAHGGTDPTSEAARAAVSQLADRWDGATSTAWRLRPLPYRCALATLPADRRGLRLGVAGDRAEPCVLDLLAHRGRLLVTGPPRAGRSTALLALAHEALRQRRPVLWWAPARSPLQSLDTFGGAQAVTENTPAPAGPALLVVDDVGGCDETTTQLLLRWLRLDGLPLAAAVAGRTDDLLTGSQPVAAAVRRERSGLLLRPAALDGELLGVRIPPAAGPSPPGRGLLVADPNWLVSPTPDPSGEPLAVQVALPP